MTLWTRLATWALQGMVRRRWGFPPRIIPAVVEQLGAASALWWWVETMAGYERARERLGPLRTHLLVTGIALLHGCRYCARGHARALELVYFARFDRLFPLDEDALLDLQGLDDLSLRTRFDRLLWDAGLPDELPTFDRMVALATGQAIGSTPEDDAIDHLVQLVAVLGVCSTRGAVPPDQAHDPINKDAALRARHRQARALERASARFVA
ncbi:MAG: hypothetical protein KDK70_25700 [Myxococcales bacterium]|nr:hypothetical protein [Myxococcales bacterium]